jgi:hypothetical protein
MVVQIGFKNKFKMAGFQLYVIMNTLSVSSVFQFGDFQFGDVQFGGAITYIDPRTIDGELVASSPNGNIGPLYEQFSASIEFGDIQFGSLLEDAANPRPRPFIIGSDPDRWGYVFFLSPFPDEIATDPNDFINISEQDWKFLKKLVIQLKHQRNWAIVQVEVT